MHMRRLLRCLMRILKYPLPPTPCASRSSLRFYARAEQSAMKTVTVSESGSHRREKMILLCGLLCIFWGEPGRCLEEGEGVTFQRDIRHLAVGTHSVYITTDDRLYQLDHNLDLVHSVTLKGVLEDKDQVENAQFQRVSETEEGNATLSVNVLLPYVQNGTLVICGVTDNDCGYCELLDPNDISKVLYSEQIQVGPPWRSSPSVSFLVNVTSDRTETYILTAINQYQDRPTKTRCSTGSGSDAVNLHNTNDQQLGLIFSAAGELSVTAIKPRRRSNVEFVDGFQVGFTIFLLSNLPSSDGGNKVRLLWLEEESGKSYTLRSLRGATLSLSDGDTGSRLLASSVIPGGPPVLWIGVFSVDGGPSNTELVVFDISPDLTTDTDQDPDFCFQCPDKTSPPESKPDPQRLKPTKVLFRQNYMTSVLAVRQKTSMVFFIGTRDGQLIKLTMDKNYHSTCPRVLYRANDEVFPRIHLDPVDLKHVYVRLQSQVKRVPVSKCSMYRTMQDCWSAQDPYCVWCSSKSSCTFEDDCQGSDWFSIPEDFQKKMVSHKLMKDSSDQITLLIQTHLTGPQSVQSSFACQFSAGSGEFCSRMSPPPQFPQCTCIIEKSTVVAEGLDVVLKIKLGEIFLTEKLKISDCDSISGPPISTLCRQCVEAGCGWSSSSCSWWKAGLMKDYICQMESGMYSSSPEISSITPSVVSFYGKNHALLLGSDLSDVTRVRIQREECTAQESPVWNNTGVQLTFHIPSTDIKGVVKVCVVLPDDSCHGNATMTYQSLPSCTDISPSTSWASGKRKITLTGSHLEFVEGIVHSDVLHEIRPPTIKTHNSLIYDTPVSGHYGTATVKVLFKVANQTLAGASITYYPDPEFTGFIATRRGDDISITIEKKADKLNMTMAELSAWGVHEGKQYPCVMKVQETSDKTDYITCIIKGTPNAAFQNLVIKYGDKTVMLGPPSLLHQVILTLRILLIPFIIFALVFIRCWQKKLTADTNNL